MRYAQLKAFHFVAQTGGFSRAAKQLSLTQPAVSDHIRKLEESYGVELFKRAPRGITLTEDGRKLFAETVTRREAVVQGLGIAIIGEGEFSPDERLHLIKISDWSPVMQEWLASLSSRAGLSLVKAFTSCIQPQNSVILGRVREAHREPGTQR